VNPSTPRTRSNGYEALRPWPAPRNGTTSTVRAVGQVTLRIPQPLNPRRYEDEMRSVEGPDASGGGSSTLEE